MILSIIAIVLSTAALCAVVHVSYGMRLGIGRVIVALRRADGLPEIPPDMENPLADVGRASAGSSRGS